MIEGMVDAPIYIGTIILFVIMVGVGITLIEWSSIRKNTPYRFVESYKNNTIFKDKRNNFQSL